MPLVPAKFTFETQHAPLTLCGIDEVGRGCLAGDVMAACVVIKPDTYQDPFWQNITDSKAIAKSKHAYLVTGIKERSTYAIGTASVLEIEQLNILHAAMLAMQRAFQSMTINIDVALIDGNRAPALPCATHAIIKGDSKSVSIAAASLIAKDYRDTQMQILHAHYPHYGWDNNAGYGTAHHLKALKTHGITEHHRKGFKPVAAFL
jgi:ribonuclease HII